MHLLAIGILLVGVLVPQVGVAGISKPARQVIESHFEPAKEHPGLRHAQEYLRSGNLRSFVTLEQGGIPAAKAEYFIANTDYDYRPVVIDVANGQFTMRRGKTYTYLDRGQVMIIAGVRYSGRTVYLELLSPSVHEKHQIQEKNPSRVSVLLGFKLPADLVKRGDGAAMVEHMQRWVKPFRSLQAAMAYAQHIGGTVGEPRAAQKNSATAHR
jgi:hypothetical protein